MSVAANYLKQNKILKAINKDYTIIYAVLLGGVIFSFVTDNFLTSANMMNILRQASIIAVIAAGQYFVMVGGAFDLSVGSVVALAGVVFAQMMVIFHMPPALAFIVALAVGALAGLINGQLVTRFNLPAFIATLGMMSAARGVVYVITDAYPVIGMPPSINFLGRGYVSFLPVPVIIMFVLFLWVYFVSEHTKTGRFILAMGGNDEAAYLSGIKTFFYKNLTFILCGGLSALSGIILASRLGSGQPNAGVGFEFDSIIACVVGGISLTGGKGKAFGVMLGAILVTELNNGMTLLNFDSYTQQIIKGIVLVIAVVIDVYRNKPRR